MIDISIIIVNYNVKHFLAQCLNSILNNKAASYTLEIIVVDNASTDGSFPYLEEKYGDRVSFIKSDQNLGFGKACNQGLQIAKGENILFLNPDTLMPPGTLEECLRLIRDPKNSHIQALGVKIVDGGGNFLPESKRSLPTIWNSFCKMSGLASLFPQATFFGGYNLTYLPQDKMAEIEALCGAFIFVRKQILRDIGGFDEQFFMYGEDLDLCKRIIENGGKILYFPEVHIVHFKGESHKEKNLQYYKQFYAAMSIYADKHYPGFLSTILKMAVFIAGITAFISRFVISKIQGLIDLGIMITAIFLVKELWATLVKGDANYYGGEFNFYAIAFPLIMWSCLYLAGHYKINGSMRNSATGFIAGVFVCLSIYALFPEDLRFSRSILLIFLGMVPILLWISKVISDPVSGRKNKAKYLTPTKVAFYGSDSAYSEFIKWSKFINPPVEIIGKVNDKDEDSLGDMESLAQVIPTYKIDELIFDSGDIYFRHIYTAMSRYGKIVNFRIAGERELGIIGSDQSNVAGSVYLIDYSYRINNDSSRFLKRIFDVIMSIFVLVTFFAWLFFRRTLLRQAIQVLSGAYTWVGYAEMNHSEIQLPYLKKGIIPISAFSKSIEKLPEGYNTDLNIRYAKNYSIFVDLEFFLKHLFADQ